MEFITSSFWEALCLPGAELELISHWARGHGEKPTALAGTPDLRKAIPDGTASAKARTKAAPGECTKPQGVKRCGLWTWSFTAFCYTGQVDAQLSLVW